LITATWTVVGALNAVAGWPRKALSTKNAADHLASIVLQGLSALKDSKSS
jgi:hypothetical protein